MTIRVSCAAAARTAVGIGATLAAAASAEPLTSPAQLSPGNGLITFSGRAPGPIGVVASIQCVQFSASPGMSIVDLSTQPYSGPLVGGPALHPLPGAIGSGLYINTSIVFPTPVSEVGLGVWDPNYVGGRLRVFNAANVLLEEVLIPIQPSGGGGASFVGIRRAAADISLAAVFPGAAADTYAIDNISYGPFCYANCDCTTVSPVLNANDFQCFLNSFAAGEAYANCDASTAVPQLTANDFQCFLNSFAAGCT